MQSRSPVRRDPDALGDQSSSDHCDFLYCEIPKGNLATLKDNIVTKFAVRPQYGLFVWRELVFGY